MDNVNVIAKVRCDSVKRNTIAGQPQPNFEAKLTPVVADSEENAKFFEATPGGEVRLDILNERAACSLVEGEEYYLILTKDKPAGL